MKCTNCGIRMKNAKNVVKKFGLHGGKIKNFCIRCSKNNSLISKLKDLTGFRTDKELAKERKIKKLFRK